MTERVGSAERPSLEGSGGFGAVLFTDIQDSTALWERHPDRMPEALARHHPLHEDAAFLLLTPSEGERCVRFAPSNADHLVVASENGTISGLTLDREELIEMARDRLFRGFRLECCDDGS